MKTSFSSALLLGALLTLGACSKDKSHSDDPKPATKTELLTAKDWMIVSASVTPAYSAIPVYAGGIPTTDWFNVLKPCEKDNVGRFEDSGVYIQDEGPIKCAPLTPQVNRGTWRFSTDETQLITDISGTHNIYTLVELAKQLKLSYGFNSGGTTYTVVYVLAPF